MKIVWKAVKHMTIRGALYGVGLGALYGVVVLIFLGGLSGIFWGAAYGAYFGGISGVLSGVANGLLVGLLTRFRYWPLTDADAYRRTATTVCAGLTMVGVVAGFGVLFGGNALYLTFIPALAAGWAAQRAARSYADQYAAAQASPTR